MKILYIYRDYKGRRKDYGKMMVKCGHEVKYLSILEKKIKNQVSKKYIKKHNPDIIWILIPFYIQYRVISDEAMEYIKSKKIPIVMYCTFNPSVPYPDMMDTWKKIDFLFLQNKEICEFLKKKNLNAHHFPLAFYPNQYYRTVSSSKKYDVSFMGNALTFMPAEVDKRAIYLQSIKKYNLKVYGESFRGRLRGIRVSPYRGHEVERKAYGVTNINLSLPFINCTHKFYRNKYHFKNRFFEIPATGNFMLTLRDPEFLDIFDEDTVGYYDANIESFKESIDRYLKDGKKRKKMAEKAYKLVHEKHTFLHRFKEMFKIIERDM